MLRLLRSPSAIGVEDSEAEVCPDPLRGLARSASEGDVQAYQTLCMALGRPILHVLRSTMGVGHPDLEDLLQETLLALHSSLPSFRGNCTVLYFACRVALHTALNARRGVIQRTQHVSSLPAEQLESMAPKEPSPAEVLAAVRRREALRQLLDDLPAVQAEVLGLHTMLGHTVEETAHALNVPVDTVRSRLRNALGALRRRLGRDRALCEIVTEGA